MIKRRLKAAKLAYQDVMGQLKRFRVAEHQGVPEHGLMAHQVYPQGPNLSFEFMAQPDLGFPKFIDKSTPMASMGACFAVPIKKYLEESDYNLISNEQSTAGSADWGRVYTTKNMLQVFQYTFGEFRPRIQFCRNAKGVFDPYREGKVYATFEEAEAGTARHHEEARNALTECQILVLTPGQNEAWITKEDGIAWTHKPPPETIAEYGEDYFALKRISIEENVEFLEESLKIFWQNNPAAKVIFMVSPVPSYGTYFDVNVAVRSFENKARLLLAVKQVVENHPEQTYYFPTFEMTMLSNNPNLQLDNRHVRKKVVKQIMGQFDECFAVDA